MIRTLRGYEPVFANQLASCTIDMAIKYQDSEYVEKALKNFRKIFAGLRTKVVDGSFAKAKEMELLKLPNYIQNCKEAACWIGEHASPIDEVLVRIARNDRLIAVTSNHSLTDAGFCIKAIQHSLDDNIGELKEFPLEEEYAFRKEIEEAKKHNPIIVPYKMNSSALCNDFDYLAPKGVPEKVVRITMNAKDLQCYDQKRNVLKSLTESMFTASCISLNAFGDNVRAPIGTPLIFDLRRFVDPSRVNWSYGNCVARLNIVVYPKPDNTLSDVYKMIRDEINRVKKHDIFTAFNLPYNGIKNHAYPCISNAGPVKVENPIVDFDVKSGIFISDKFKEDDENGFSIHIFSFSKIFSDRNLVEMNIRIPRTKFSYINEMKFIQSFKHFLTKISPSTKYIDAFNEIKHLQNKIEKEY